MQTHLANQVKILCIRNTYTTATNYLGKTGPYFGPLISDSRLKLTW